MSGPVGVPAEQERLARVVLSRIGEPGDPRLTGLVADLGAGSVLEQLRGEAGRGGLAADVAVRLEGCDPVAELDRAARLGIRFVAPGDPEWPVALDDLARAGTLRERGGVPVGLWVRGPASLTGLAGAVAVVGSRSATSYGEAVARELAAELAHHGHVVVSGAAYGIDVAAHRGALAGGGPTIAVLACGADRVYPTRHAHLLEHLVDPDGRAGAVISETPPGGAPTRVRFLARNRLIAAVTGATVVVEAAVRSGALNTATWAERMHRQVAGVPGPVTSAASQGVHQLVRRGGAVLVTRAEEVLELVAPAGQGLLVEARGPATPRDRLTARQQQVLDGVPVHRAAPADAVARAAGVRIVEVAGELERLRALGQVERSGSGWRLAAGGQGG